MKKIVYSIGIILLIVTLFLINEYNSKQNNVIEKNKILIADVIYKDKDKLTLKDDNNIIYTLNFNDLNINLGDRITIEYNKELNKNKDLQDINILDYKIINSNNKYNMNEEDIFGKYYNLAIKTLQSLTLDEKIGQLFLVRVPKENATDILKEYQFGGYLFFERNFKNKTKDDVLNMVNTFQKLSKIPLLTAIDEEGGKVTRLSNNKNLVKTPFKSSQELYKEGGFSLIREDTINKSKILTDLGLNLNLAPVVDVTMDKDSYIFPRTLGEDYITTGIYAKTVIESSKNTKVSYTLKHFPGYGNNSDTHLDISIDNRNYLELLNKDLLPFREGINEGCEAIMISHNIINNIDKNNPASLSPSIHNLLRNELGFSGIVITDDLYMGAVSKIENNALKALINGNDLIITTDYEKSINEIKNALANNIISEKLIEKTALRVIAWKYYKNLL